MSFHRSPAKAGAQSVKALNFSFLDPGSVAATPLSGMIE